MVTNSGNAGCSDHGSWANDFICNICVSLSGNRGNSTHLWERGDENSVSSVVTCTVIQYLGGQGRKIVGLKPA